MLTKVILLYISRHLALMIRSAVGLFPRPSQGHLFKDNATFCSPDCCDGSDEYSGAIECPNICDELGKSAREEKQRQAEIARKGFANRKVLAAEGQKLRVGC